MIQSHPSDPDSPVTSSQSDPYNPREISPLATKAIESSCWELKALQGHYNSSISTMAKVFTEAFTKPEFMLEDFLDHGYGTVRLLPPLLPLLLPPALGMTAWIHLDLPFRPVLHHVVLSAFVILFLSLNKKYIQSEN
jgi:U3 small nucleolar RNA-associated protein 19